MQFDSDAAREAGQRSGEVRRAKALAGMLTPDEVAARLLPMTTPDNVRQNLEAIQAWACAGRLSAGNAGAAVRACAEALKAIELGAELGQVAELSARLEQLEAEKHRPHGAA